MRQILSIVLAACVLTSTAHAAEPLPYPLALLDANCADLYNAPFQLTPWNVNVEGSGSPNGKCDSDNRILTGAITSDTMFGANGPGSSTPLTGSSKAIYVAADADSPTTGTWQICFFAPYPYEPLPTTPSSSNTILLGCSDVATGAVEIRSPFAGTAAPYGASTDQFYVQLDLVTSTSWTGSAGLFTATVGRAGGATGPPGATGATGPTGATGATGAQGATVTACSSGCDATVICNAACTTPTSSICDPGSAVEVVRARSPSLTNPQRILVLPGSYPECVALNNITDVTLEVTSGAVIRPAVTANNSVNGGALRIGNDTTLRGARRIRVIVDGLIQNDAFSSPEAAIQLGQETCPSSSSPTWGEVDVEINSRIVGHHDGYQICGDTNEGPATTQLPKDTLHGSGTVYSGRDACTKKGNTISDWDMDCVSWDNYCEAATETFLTAQTGTALGGTASTAILEAADDAGLDDFYANRMVRFSDADGGGAGVCGTTNQCAGVAGVIISYDSATDTATFSGDACNVAVTTGCTYTIDAVANFKESPCRDKDWNVIASTSGLSAALWKSTGVHFGVDGPVTPSALDRLAMRDSKIHVILNEASMAGSGCAGPAGQGHVSGILTYASTPTYGRATFDDVDITIDLNSDQRTTTCARPLAGIGLSGKINSFLYDGGRIIVNNAADPNLPIYGLVADPGAGPFPLTVGDAFIDINNTAPGFAAATSLLHATANGTIDVKGQISSPDLLTVNATAQISGWSDYCAPRQVDIGVTGFPATFLPIENGLVGAKIHAAACQCFGTCGAAETVLLSDEAGDAIGTITCTDGPGAKTWQDVSADADGTLGVGQQPQYDDGTDSGVATDDTLLCLRYTTNRWVN